MHKHPIEGGKKGAARLLSAISSEKTMDSGHKLKYKKFHLDIRKNFLL